jgi:hypothetical protein
MERAGRLVQEREPVGQGLGLAFAAPHLFLAGARPRRKSRLSSSAIARFRQSELKGSTLAGLIGRRLALLSALTTPITRSPARSGAMTNRRDLR